jgi:hypothetical protein
MGLGKSLTVLSTIIDAIPRAVDFATQKMNSDIATKQVQTVVPSKATLILVPSACKLTIDEKYAYKALTRSSAFGQLD